MKIQSAPNQVNLPKLLPAPTPAESPTPTAPVADSVQLAAPQAEAEAKPEAELSLGQRLIKGFFQEKRVPGKETEGSPFMKLMFGGVVASGAWCTAKVIADIAGAPTLGAAIGTAALSAGALAVGYVAADLPSGLLHHWADNYAKPDAKLGFVRKFAKQA